MRRYGALLTLGVTLALSCATPTLAHAAAPACSTVVTDDAGVLSPAQLAELRKHAAGLAAKTELRIRTEQSLFTGTLNGDEGSLQQDCKWASSAGVRQPVLLVIMVATESRQMGIYPGTALVGQLPKPVWLAIEQKDMRPHFAEADWVGGLEAGIDALSKTLAETGPLPSPAPSATAASSPAVPSASAAAASASAAAASASAAGVVPVQGDAGGNINQGDGSAEHPFVGTSTGSDNGGIIAIVALGAIAVVGSAVFGLVRGGGSSRRRGHYGPDGVWINTPFDSGSHHHNPGMFGGGGFGGGGDSGGGGGGGSSSDGGGGSSGF